MKKLLVVLIALAVASPAFAVVKKEIKKHKKFDGSKVADDKGTKPVAPAKKKK